jgi:uncharacterized damage-inducible protein DinB
MDVLQATVGQGMAARVEELAGKITALAQPLSEEQFWTKPFAFGNSFGHLILHLTGNLNYYIGAQIAATGYVRNRPREFAETDRPQKKVALQRFEEAVAMAARTIRAQSEKDWSQAYTAVGADHARNRFDIVLTCTSHLNHHLGQMQYLCYGLGKS